MSATGTQVIGRGAKPGPRWIASPAFWEAAAGDTMRRRRMLWLLLLVVLAGTIGRVRQYAARTSYWSDEAFMVLNVMDHPAGELVGHLDHGQAAPPGFLALERGAYVVAGPGEYAMRLEPLICGIAALALFALTAWRLLPPPVAVCAAVFFALCDTLVAYSAEAKQYSGDVLMSVVLLPLASAPSASPVRKLAWVALATAIGIWFSHTTAIVFAAASAVISLQCLRDGRRGLAWAFACNGLVAVSFAALYLLSIRHQHTRWMHEGWLGDFADWSRPAGIPRWAFAHFYDLCSIVHRSFGGLTLAMIVLGAAGLITTRRADLLVILIGPVVLTLMAALAQQYPFNGSRVTLFLLPQLLLLAAAGCEFTARLLPSPWAGFWWALPLVLLIVGVTGAVSRFAHPLVRSQIRPAVEYVREHRQEGEALYITGTSSHGRIDPEGREGRHLELLCYWRHPPEPFHSLWPGAANIPEHRFWVVYAFDAGHDNDRAAKLLHELRTVADERAHFVDPQGGAAYLFEKAKQ